MGRQHRQGAAHNHHHARDDLAVGEGGTVRELGREETVQISNT